MKRHNRAQATGEDDTDSEDEDDDAPSVTDSLQEDGTTTAAEVKDPVTGQRGPAKGESSVAADVMQRKGVYGRFADKWFSRKGWSTDSRRTQGLSSQDNSANAPKNVESMPKKEETSADPSASDLLPDSEQSAPDTVNPEDIPKVLDGQKDATKVALLPKIPQTTRMYFSTGNFFFSYDYDLSHSVGTSRPNSSLPLFKQFDPLVCSASPHRVAI